ncbi:uncharacterized protein LOC125491385 [Plutella xylostella]|uniref:uncharacterized protein LOC125491385 n=1 Tax=Plutella xylostella TaxID=51655 RepID=UPI002032EB9A|nr:uncharacterized protein LOC125491385 [Plutella xylostella]
MYALSPETITDCKWWLKHLSDISPIFLKATTMFITTDASDLGWGATINGKKQKGQWNTNQKSWHCNRKELWTVYITLKKNEMTLRGHTCLVQSDNRTVVAYLQKQGGTKSLTLLRMTRAIFLLADQLNITINAKYIPGRYNATADSLSRHQELPEWSLSNSVTDMIFNKWGTPEIDLFASARSRVVKKYATEDAQDRKALFIDAFAKQWNWNLAWIFPPPCMMPRILCHLNTARGTYLIVCPRWHKVYWRADLKARATAAPFTIKDLQSNLMDHRTQQPPPEVKDLQLEVWRVRGGPPK